jgi:pimeloyl-ACP methyl ester carboxylesterase
MTFYTRRGQGEPLLLVQGMGGHHQFWGDWFLDLLEPHFDVVAYDHRGIGRSPWADGPFTIADLADDAADLIKSLGWSSAHVFGISLGGMVVQELTLRHPSLVRTLTIGCSWAGGPDGELSQTVRRILEAQATRNVDHAVRTGYEGNLSREFAADPAHYARYRELALAERVPLPVILMQWEAAQQHDTTARLPTITTPTLVLHGTADVNMAVHNGEHIASLIPGARLELLDGAGHLFWWEQPERTAELLRGHAAGGA